MRLTSPLPPNKPLRQKPKPAKKVEVREKRESWWVPLAAPDVPFDEFSAAARARDRHAVQSDLAAARETRADRHDVSEQQKKPAPPVTPFLSADLYRDPRNGLRIGCDRDRARVFTRHTFCCDCGFIVTATTDSTLAEGVQAHIYSPAHDEAA